MRTSTVKSAWHTFTTSITDDNDLIRCLRLDPTRQATLECMDYAALCTKMEHDWRTFISQAERVEQKKGYVKRCANTLALQIVDEKGPATLLTLLLSEFKVDANLKDTLGTYMFTTTLRSGITDNAMVLINGYGKNKDNRFRKDMQWAKFCIFKILSLNAHRHFDPISGTYVDSTAFLLKAIFNAGASLYNTFTHLEDSPVDTDGYTVWCHVAHTGNMEAMKLLLAHSAEHKVHIDMNTKHRTNFNQYCRHAYFSMLQFVTQKGAFTEAGVPCVPCERNCGYRNCNMPMVKLSVANGVNPYISESDGMWYSWIHTGGVSQGRMHLSLCPEGRAQLGMAMYERVQSSRALVIWAMRGRFPSDVVALICTCAGIGETRMADTKAPWVASMPIRTDDVDSMWFGSYVLIDKRINELKVMRSS